MKNIVYAAGLMLVTLGMSPLNYAFGMENGDTLQAKSTNTQRMKYQDNPNTKLMEACMRGSITRAADAIKNGADVNKIDGPGMNPLMIAANNGEYEMVKWLVEEQNADVNARSKELYGRVLTPLQCALKSGKTEIIEYLRAHGATDEGVDVDKGTLLSKMRENAKKRN